MSLIGQELNDQSDDKAVTATIPLDENNLKRLMLKQREELYDLVREKEELRFKLVQNLKQLIKLHDSASYTILEIDGLTRATAELTTANLNTEERFSDFLVAYNKTVEALQKHQITEVTLNEKLDYLETQYRVLVEKRSLLEGGFQDGLEKITNAAKIKLDSIASDMDNLNVQIKRAELRVASFENELKQKTAECRGLSTLFDNFAKSS